MNLMIVTSILVIFSPEGDHTFGELKDAFCKTGRGRRKEVKLDINKRLLLQMRILKENTGKTWEDIEAFLSKFTSESTPNRMRSLIESTAHSFLRLKTEEEIAGFLDEPVDMDSLGDFCREAGITRKDLTEGAFEFTDHPVVNGLIIELEHFRSKQGLPFNFQRASLMDIQSGRCRCHTDKTKEDGGQDQENT